MKFLKLATVIAVFTTFLQAEMIKVTESTVITKPYTQKVKIGEQCYEDTVEVNVKCGNTDTNSIGVDTLVGTIIGVAIGNQIGKGNGKDVAKIIGGVGGAVTANSLREKTCKSYETITRCEPKYEYQTKYKTIGYNNCALYDGVKYCKQTQEPVEWLKIKKTVTVY